MCAGEHWRKLPFDVGSSMRHIAQSDTLVRLISQPTIWWHATEHPTLILGAGQNLHDIDMDACRARQVIVVKRDAGGTSVLADGETLGMDLALPAGHALVAQDVVESYRWVGEVWVVALRSLGVPVRLVEIAEARQRWLGRATTNPALRLACFGELSPYEVVVRDRKLVGLAQVRRRAGMVVQSGLHLRFDAERLSALLPTAEREGLTQSLRRAALGLDEAAGRYIDSLQVRSAWETALKRMLRVDLVEGMWSPSEVQMSDETFSRISRIVP